MNRYGLTAQEHWARHAPSRYAAIEDPQEFFTDLGEQVAALVATMSEHLEQVLPRDLPYLEQVAALRAVQKQAEDAALAELVFSVPAESTSLLEELEEMLGDLPDRQIIAEQLTTLSEQVAQEAESEGYSQPIWSPEQEAARDRLTALLPLVSVPGDLSTWTEAQVRDRIVALREFWSPQP